MRTVKLVEAMSELGSNIQTILEYLALNEEHFVTFVLCDPVGQILVYNHLSMKEDGSIVNKVILKGEKNPVKSIDFEPTLRVFEGVISYSKQQQPSDEYKDTFSSKWEEIVKVTELNVGANKWRQDNIL